MNLILNHWRHNVFLFLQSWNMCTCRVFRKHYGPVVWTRTSVCSCLCAQINRYYYHYYYYNLTSVQRRQRRGWKVINRLFAQRWVDENCNRLRIPLFQSQMFTNFYLTINKSTASVQKLKVITRPLIQHCGLSLLRTYSSPSYLLCWDSSQCSTFFFTSLSLSHYIFINDFLEFPTLN